MEVVAEAGAQQPWDQFKEEVEIMEEQNGGGGADAVEELLTREIRRRLGHAHGSSNGDGNHHASGGDEEEEDDASGGDEEDHANGGGEEEAVVEEEEVKVEEQQQRHKSIVFDPAKVPDIITEVTASYHVTGTMRSSAEKEDTNGTLTPKGKGLIAYENGNAQEINQGPSNGVLQNGSHANGSHQALNGTEPKIAYTFKINRTQIYPTEVDKDGHVTEAEPKVEEYDLEKILDEQETYDLFCPNCTSCITRRVILKKRKRTVRTTPTDEPSKRPYIEGQVPPVPLPDRVEEESPDVFRCLSCFSFFIPTGCSFNIFRIFGRRNVDGQPDVLPPPASEDTPPRSENCTSWLLSCFQTGDSRNQSHPADPMTVPLLSGNTTTVTESESSTSHVYHSHGTVVKPEHPTVESPSENQADPADSPRIPSLPGIIATPSGATTTTTETNESYVQHSHGTQQLTVDSSSQHQKTTTTVEDNETTTTVTSEKNTTSSKTTTGAPSASPQTSSSTEYFKQDISEVVTGKMPSGGAIMHPTHHLIGDKGRSD
uniref:Uncharacterized protein n=1 Tax=Aegilops tauschii subsp. strangulata TaxID=200361 RepID=A0A453QDQ0_AEGTS